MSDAGTILDVFLTVFLIALCIAGVWALVQMVFVMRKTNQVVDELAESVNNTLAEVNPVINKVDGLLDEVTPVIKQVDPLLISAIGAVDSLSKDLDNLDVILGDVSRLTSGVADAGDAATHSVTGAMTAASNLVGAAIDRVRGEAPKKLVSRVQSARETRAEAKAEAELVEPIVTSTKSGDDGYFKYPSATPAAPAAPAEADKPADGQAE